MSLDRRSFVAAAVSLTASAVAHPAAALEDGRSALLEGPDDPLGVRADFPIARQRTFLNSAYIAPIPRQVVDAGHAFLQEKANNSFQLGSLLRKCDEVRAQFARLSLIEQGYMAKGSPRGVWEISDQGLERVRVPR